MPIATAVSRCPDSFQERGVKSLDFGISLRVVRSDASVVDAGRFHVVCEFTGDELGTVI